MRRRTDDAALIWTDGDDTSGGPQASVLECVEALKQLHMTLMHELGRRGGDEFACLLADVPNRVQLSHLACKLYDAVSTPFQLGKLSLTVRPSIGIAMCPGDGATSDDLLRNADAAMYRAKRHQIGYAFFEEAAAAEPR